MSRIIFIVRTALVTLVAFVLLFSPSLRVSVVLILSLMRVVLLLLMVMTMLLLLLIMILILMMMILILILILIILLLLVLLLLLLLIASRPRLLCKPSFFRTIIVLALFGQSLVPLLQRSCLSTRR
jgi:hypothetical protein